MYAGLIIKTAANPPDIVWHLLQPLSAEFEVLKKWRTSFAGFDLIGLAACFLSAAEIRRTQEVLWKREALSLTPPDKMRERKPRGKKRTSKVVKERKK